MICVQNTGTPCPAGTPPLLPLPVGNSASSTPNAETTDDPIQTATGEYFLRPQMDINLGGPLPLIFSRSYAARLQTEGFVHSALGGNWMHNFDIRLTGISASALQVVFTGGKIISFKKTGANWGLSASEASIYQLKQDAAGNFLLLDPSSRLVYLFNATGVLQSIQDRNGNTQTLTRDAAGNLTQVADGLGRTLSFTYAGGNLTQVTDGTRTVNYAYTAGALTSTIDPMGHTTTYLYDTTNITAGPLMTGMQLPLGNNHYTQAYDASGRVTTQTDAFANAMTLQFDTPSIDVTTLTDPLGNSRQTTHQYQRSMTNRQDMAGNAAAFAYDANNRRTAITDRLGDTSSTTYHAQTGYVATSTDANGGTIRYTYTAQNQRFGAVPFTFYNLSRVDYPDGANQQFTFDGKGNILSQVDQAGNTTAYTLDSRGQILTTTLPTGGKVTYTYNPDATPASKTNSDTGITTYVYDAFKRLVKKIRPDGAVLLIAYDLKDRITSITDENGNVTSTTYDANGNLLTETDPAGNMTRYAYDLMDRVTSVTDRLGNAVTYTYDSMDHLTTMADANHTAITFAYDARGWLDKTTAGGQIWQTVYDAEGVASSFSTPLGRNYQMQTNKRGLPTGATDPLGNSTAIARDAMGRVTSVTDPLSRATSYTYDNRGLLGNATLPNVGTAIYTRNSLGLLTGITDTNGNHWGFGYTGMGHLQSTTDPLNATSQYAYDTRGRLSGITYPGGATLNRSYDNVGNLIRKLYSDGTDIQFAYNALGQLTGANGITVTRDKENQVIDTSNSGISFGAAYDNGGRLKTVTYNNGALTVTYAYDPTTGLLSGVTDSLTGVQTSFTYDVDSQLLGVMRSNGVSTTFTRDAAGRISRIQHGSLGNLQYTRDAAGQITGLNSTLPLNPSAVLIGSTGNLTYDAANQVNAAGFVYDQLGRRTASPAASYGWNLAGRMTSTATASLVYNGIGDLIARSEGGATVGYQYNYAIGLHPILAENDVAGTPLRYYIYTPNGRLLYMIDAKNANKVYFYHFNQVGSTLFLTDVAGAVTDSYAYSPYGSLLQHNGVSQQPFTYIGEWGIRQEGSSGTLYQMRARYYDATTGSFLSRDSLWPALAHPRSINPYQYALGKPTQLSDITGLRPYDPVMRQAQRLIIKDVTTTVRKTYKKHKHKITFRGVTTPFKVVAGSRMLLGTRGPGLGAKVGLKIASKVAPKVVAITAKIAPKVSSLMIRVGPKVATGVEAAAVPVAVGIEGAISTYELAGYLSDVLFRDTGAVGNRASNTLTWDAVGFLGDAPIIKSPVRGVGRAVGWLFGD